VRAENEAALWWEIEAFKKVNRDQHFDNEAKKMELEKLEASRTTIEQEMQRMKDTWDRSKEELAKQISSEIAKVID
jgi:cell division protein FtsB